MVIKENESLIRLTLALSGYTSNRYTGAGGASGAMPPPSPIISATSTIATTPGTVSRTTSLGSGLSQVSSGDQNIPPSSSPVAMAHSAPYNRDYKKLYEAEHAEKVRLLKQVEELENRIAVLKMKSTVQTVESLETQNQKLKNENAALIRVISKLSKD